MYTFGSQILALQVPGDANPFAGSGDVVTLIADTTPINQAVLVLLVLFSVASWTIILQKLWMFRVLDRETARFLEVFRRSSKFSEVQAVCQTVSATASGGCLPGRLCGNERSVSRDERHGWSFRQPWRCVRTPDAEEPRRRRSRTHPCWNQ